MSAAIDFVLSCIIQSDFFSTGPLDACFLLSIYPVTGALVLSTFSLLGAWIFRQYTASNLLYVYPLELII